MVFIKKIKKLAGTAKSRILRLSLRKKIILSVAILLFIGLLAKTIINQNSPTPQYQTAQVQKGTIISTVNESGNVASNSQAGVGSPTTGIVEEIYVKDGDTVTQGENLFKVKSIATAQEIASAYANYLSALSNLNSAQAKINSLQAALFVANQKFVTDRGVINPSDQQKADPVYIEENATWQQAQADYKNQSTAIAQAQAALNNASLIYQTTQDSIITAPISGTVANIGVKPGDQVTASAGNLSSNSSSTTTSSSSNSILSIGNYSTPYIKVQASEVDIINIHSGQKATVSLNAFSGKTFVGTVDQVDTAGAISSGVVTYNAYITLIAPPSTIRPGMSASVTIQTEVKDNVLTVPSAAIQTSNGQSSVRVIKNGKISNVDVSTGITSDTDTEVTSGLSEGDTVITGATSGVPGVGNSASPFGRNVGGFGGGFGGGGGAVRRAGGGG